jgi:hypothetical protein
MNHKAIYTLYPQVVTIHDDTGAFDKDGIQVEIDMDLVDDWQDPDQYKFDRVKEYPQIADQLDMLWHAIDTNRLNKDSDFYKTLKQVKDNYPKPE